VLIDSILIVSGLFNMFFGGDGGVIEGLNGTIASAVRRRRQGWR